MPQTIPNDIQRVRQWFRRHKSALYAGITALAADAAAQQALLDDRDAAPFDDDWMTAYRSNDARKAALAIAARSALEGCAASVARDAFLFTMRASGNSELAACVADDFQLMAEVLASGAADAFVLSLLACYRAGKVPDNSMARGGEAEQDFQGVERK